MSWPLASFLVVAVVLLAGWLAYERARPSARMVAVVATLAALAALGRDAFVALPEVKPITAMTLVVGYALGPLPGFTVGALGMLASNMMLGQGPYTPWQMAAWGLVGLVGAVLGRLTRRRMSRLSLALACALTAFLAKEIMDLYTWTIGATHTPAAFLAIAAGALPFDLTDAIASFFFGLAFAPELARVLARIRARMDVHWDGSARGAVVSVLLLVALVPTAHASAARSESGLRPGWAAAVVRGGSGNGAGWSMGAGPGSGGSGGRGWGIVCFLKRDRARACVRARDHGFEGTPTGVRAVDVYSAVGGVMDGETWGFMHGAAKRVAHGESGLFVHGEAGPVAHSVAGRVVHGEAARVAHSVAGRVVHGEAARVAHSVAGRVVHGEAARVAHSVAGRVVHGEAARVAHSVAGRVVHGEAARVAHSVAGRVVHGEAARVAHSVAGRVVHGEAARVAHSVAGRVVHGEAARVAHSVAGRVVHGEAARVAHSVAGRVVHGEAARVAHSKVARVARADFSRELAYLTSAQSAGGGFGAAPGQSTSELYTGWVAIGLAAGGRDPADMRRDGRSVLDALRAQAPTLSGPGDLERTILALYACHAPVGAIDGKSLVGALLGYRHSDGSFAEQVNITAFAIFALRAAGISAGGPTIGAAARWLERQQNADGGFSFDAHGAASDVDDTAAALQALIDAGAGRGSSGVSRAVSYIVRAQNLDGGLPQQPGGESNAQSTAWAIQGLDAAGRGVESVRRRGSRSPLGYLESLLAPNGSIRYSRTSAQAPVWVTAEALPALAGEPFPVGPVG